MANRIREWREARNMTLEQLALSMGTSSQQVSRLERGDRRLTDDWLNLASKALDVSKADLIIDNVLFPCRREFAKDKEEVRLLRAWRTLNDDERNVLIRAIESLKTQS